jgi:hypothetical protein
MKTAVLVPSHIYYPDQLSRLDTCLDSLCSQTVVPDIFVSISFANDTYKREFATLLRKYPIVKFTLSAKQKFQMEHLSILTQFVRDYDMIMFCDDDDTYLPMRVEKFVDAFDTVKEHCHTTGLEVGGVREVEDTKQVLGYLEYWAYGIPPSLLIEFFHLSKKYEDLMRHKFADMYLRTYLRRTRGKSIIFNSVSSDISGTLMYQYTKNNPNSICARQREDTDDVMRHAEFIRDTVTLGLICNRDDIIKDQMDGIHTPLSRIREVVPDTDRIKQLTKILYPLIFNA